MNLQERVSKIYSGKSRWLPNELNIDYAQKNNFNKFINQVVSISKEWIICCIIIESLTSFDAKPPLKDMTYLHRPAL